MSHRMYSSRGDQMPVQCGAALNGRVRGVAGNILAPMARLTKMKI